MGLADLYSGGPLIMSGAGEPALSVLGVPFDSTHSYRPGCRFGPQAIREAFNNIEVYHPGSGTDLEDVAIDDMGDLAHTVLTKQMLKMVSGVVAEAVEARPLVLLGGEHSLTYGSYTAVPGRPGLVVLDAHYDLRDELAGVRDGHASFLRRIAEERGGDSIIHVGARAFAREEAEYLAKSGIRTVTARDIEDGRGPALLADLASTLGSAYLSVDIDVLDPAFAPGVGNPEAAGITSRELLALLGALDETRLPCSDIVELNPVHDSGAAAAAAARVLSWMAESAVRHASG
ncbi:MAG: agmatinase [Nitrosopumilus sp.]|nr:agmatinase [Nitrosopumilus sp.]MDA7957517.1 agmatinase [Nitrosopumilus sp.]MDA7959621.1 agmatinase [Nitrosopumilus sp.]